MELHALGFIVSLRKFNYLDYELGAGKSEYNQEVRSICFFVYHMFPKIYEHVRYAASHLSVQSRSKRKKNNSSLVCYLQYENIE